MREAKVYTISAPSGAGKTSLVNNLIQMRDKIALSVSHTTRKPRAGEIDGQHYHFISESEFIDQRENFLEHAKVFGNYYGTHREQVTQYLEQDFDVLLEIDWQGAKQIKQHMSDTSLAICILPPSILTLRQRLCQRNTDSPDEVELRVAEAVSEMKYCKEADYIIFNEEFNLALQQISSIIEDGSQAQHLARSHQLKYHADKIQNLLGE